MLVGNSIGSLVSLEVAARSPELVRGVLLNNCAGGMNSKFAAFDEDLPAATRAIASVAFGFVDWLLSFKGLARSLFDGIRSEENVRAALQQVYTKNPSRVDDLIVESTIKPAEDPAALDVFVEILTGDPGPRPADLVPRVEAPIHCHWGDADEITPLRGPTGQLFRDLAAKGKCSLTVAEGVGHVPHDDSPSTANADFIAWLGTLK